jgi:hypothetical protein
MVDLFEKSACRFCRSNQLEQILDMGNVAISGVFKEDGLSVPRVPLVLSHCSECQLLQLQHSYSLEKLFTDSYGYESGLNSTMNAHLRSKASQLQAKYKIFSGVVLDIASNDGTLLSGYTAEDLLLVGVDPLIEVFSNNYPNNTIKISEYFTKEVYLTAIGRQASLITSNAVLYDINDPLQFARDIAAILCDEGIWHFEQSYMLSMLDSLSYDTICHEHLLYLSLKNISQIVNEAGLQIIDLTFNQINGGSVAVTAIKSKKKQVTEKFDYYFKLEKERNVEKMLIEFPEKVELHGMLLREKLHEYSQRGFKILGLGASTKGNILLQKIGLSHHDIGFIGDINPKKFGLKTPGSNIPIVPESDVLCKSKERKLAMVLPWHFAESIISKTADFLSGGNHLLLPLPKLIIK